MIGLACSTVSCDGFGNNHFLRSFQVMPKVGYKYIEFNCWHPSDILPSNIKRLKYNCEETGLIPISIYGSSFGGEEITKDVAYKIRMMEAALELGCRRIVATGYPRGKGGGLDAAIKVLKEITPFAEGNGILICLEHHANNAFETVEDYQRIFSEIPSPNVGLCTDTGHIEAAGISLNTMAEQFPTKINHIHVKETIKFGVEQFVRFGEGVTDNNSFIEKMVDIGYNGYISVELAIPDKSNVVEDLTVAYNMFHKYETV